MIITRLSDESVVARDTAAWFIGRTCDIVPEAAINENFFEQLLSAMVNGLTGMSIKIFPVIPYQ